MKLINPILGTPSGKLGSTVFMNKEGKVTARLLGGSKGIRTTKLQNNSAINDSSMQSWSGVNAPEKINWTVFAKNLFKPRGRTNDGRTTGYGSFLSLANTARKMSLINFYQEWFDGGGLVAPQGSPLPFAVDLVAPSNSFSVTVLADGAVSPLPLEFVRVELAGFLVRTFFKCTGASAGDTIPFPQFRDANNNECGFALYLSDPYKGTGYYFRNRFYSAICATFPYFNVSKPLLAGEFGIFWNNTDFDMSSYVGSSDNDFVMLTVCYVTKNGRLQVIGSQEMNLGDLR